MSSQRVRRVVRPVRLHVQRLESRQVPATFYVAPTGSDAGAGSASAPWLTLQHAANTVRAGDSVIVRAGDYVGFDLRTDGTAAARITFSAEPNVRIITHNPRTADGINLEGADYVTVEGFSVIAMPRAGIRTVLSQGNTIRNNASHQNGYWGILTGFCDDLLIENNVTTRSVNEHGIYVSNSGDRPTIRNNTIWGNRANGIHMNGDIIQGGDGIISGALVEGNVIYDNGVGGGSGINCDGVQNSRIQNNLIYNTHASGISLYRIDGEGASSGNVVVNNTVFVAADGRWALNIQDAATGNQAFNNILLNLHAFRGSISISSDSLPGYVGDNNVVMDRFTTDGGTTRLTLAQWRTVSGGDANSRLATPAEVFVDPATNDYRPKAGGPAVDAGTATQAPVRDLTGAARPQGAGYEIGAYELPGTPPPPPPPPPPGTGPVVAVGSGNGLPPSVRVYNPDGSLRFTLAPFEAAFTSGVRVATGDVTGDGTPDIVVGEAFGGGPYVKVFNGTDGSLLRAFFAYDPAFRGGVFVAAGDVTGDGRADIITGAGTGGGPHIKVFSGTDGALVRDFFAYEPAFRGGVPVAAGDVTGDGRADVVTGTGVGGGPLVRVFNGATGALAQSYFAYDPAFRGGVWVSAGDLDGDGRADVLAGAGVGGGPHVKVFSGANPAVVLRSFMAFEPAFAGGVRVAAVDLTGDGRSDIITGPGTGGGPLVRARNGADLAVHFDLMAFDPASRGGVFVG